MDKEKVQSLFNEFLGKYDDERLTAVWDKQSTDFKRFWKDKILNDSHELTTAEIDEVVLILDKNAKGAREFRLAGGEHIARTGIYQGVWHRAFLGIKKKKQLQKILSKIFDNHDNDTEIKLIDELESINREYRNGLTGANANILNAILFADSPRDYLSVVSINHRYQVIEAFGFGNPDSYKTYGQKVVNTSEDIRNGFKDKYGIDTSPRTLSVFFYSSHPINNFWHHNNAEESKDTEDVDTAESEFAIEKHLEDFLVANWESTDLAKKWELIFEENTLVSQQYQTSIGQIDLLVKNKKDGTYVVIELKKGQTSDVTAGQLTRYMGWVKENLAKNKQVKGVVIANGRDERLRLALSMIPNTEFVSYKINFELKGID